MVVVKTCSQYKYINQMWLLIVHIETYFEKYINLMQVLWATFAVEIPTGAAWAARVVQQESDMYRFPASDSCLLLQSSVLPLWKLAAFIC